MKISKIKKKIHNYNFLCVGASHIDNILKLENKYKLYRTNPVHSLKQSGGVAHNIANNIKLFTNNINLFSLPNKQIRKNIFQKKIKYHSISNIQNDSFYTAVLNESGKLFLGLASNEAYEKLKKINNLIINKYIKKNSYIIIDLCFNKSLTNNIINYYYKRNIKIMVAGTSLFKIYRIRKSLNKITALSLNEDEILMLSRKKTIQQSINYILNKNSEISLVITRGSKPVIMVLNGIRYIGIVPKIKIKNENGAGDALAAMFFLCIAANFHPITILSLSIAFGCLNVMDYKYINMAKFNNKLKLLLGKIKVKKYAS